MKNKIELIDQDSYYRAFKQWLDSSSDFYDTKNENLMNEKWLKFADDVGIFLGGSPKNEKITAEVLDKTSWKEAKKYYSIISYETNAETDEVSV